ncbi:MAG: cation:proton antiporter [Raoultibacter sp.]
MTIDLVSLATIALVAALTPIVAQIIPRKPIPEIVFLLIAGALLGPYAAGIIQLSESVDLLSELGLAFLFLLAGYEINPKSLTGPQGKRGLTTWTLSLLLALCAVFLSPNFSLGMLDGVAIAIAMTTTALGALLPIMKERNLVGTRVGDSILSYGTWGELGPVLAMALLLSTRAEWLTILILFAFLGIAVLTAILPAKAKKAGNKLFDFLSANANTTAQTMMRLTVLLLIGLITVSSLFKLDIVLGSFAAGFILRYVIPEGNTSLETKLDGIAYGFLIPIFFVVSGAKIDLHAVVAQPAILIGFIVMLLLVRAVPVFVALSTGKETSDMSSRHRMTVALYCTTALPVIVAVTSVAVKAGAMDQTFASILVSAGAITVFLMPLLASITYRVADAQPIEAVREIHENPRDIRAILHDHVALEHLLAKQDSVLRAATREKARTSAFLARHTPSATAPMEVWLPRAHADQALKALNTPDINSEQWEETKRLGDMEWQTAKEDGDRTWQHLKIEGDKRWDAIKEAGDETVKSREEDRRAKLGKQGLDPEGTAEGVDRSSATPSMLDERHKRVVRRAALEQERRVNELRRRATAAEEKRNSERK